ncbi:cell surface protein [Rhizobium sp. NFR12]|uniref:capsular polysaccharide export protein, LipB/KpsS family n=1 Tax=Rhizobium sp. NFR12 TaxID=1566261 RepID=UPI0008A79FF1|nr:cell surface protein [Rhizobium sp. NFR12]SEH23855.1 Capsule polysaccharide biosynthesis protein [Rhizobium sp. NFR12]
MIAAGVPGLDGRHVFAVHIRRWKRGMLEAYFPHSSFQYLPLYLSDLTFVRDWQDLILATPGATLLVWSRNVSDAILEFAHSNHIPLVFLEDGFIRSLVGNASKSLPFSLTLDSRTPYFDSRQPSDLEDILNRYDFDADPDLMERARAGIDLLLRSGLSKYNSASRQGAGADVLAVKAVPADSVVQAQRRILVIGQVEDDASIRFGCDRPFTNNDLVRLAATENPDAEILYKPHPDVLNGVRAQRSDPSDVAHLATIVSAPVSLPELLARADHVYAITSLAGFEALLRGLPVTLAGCPFYAGWGLTDDRQPNPRRGRRLTIEQLFAAAYLLYPRYFNPVDGTQIDFETCLALALQWREKGMPETQIREVPMPARPGFEMRGAYGLFGWRHLLTVPIAWLIKLAGSEQDARDFRRNPILFFRELSNPWLRRLGRILYPLDGESR